MKTVTPIINRTRVSTERYEVCPHCQEEIGEKSLYMDDENYLYHRPCKDKGPIKLIKPAKIEWVPGGGIRAVAEMEDGGASEPVREFFHIDVPYSNRAEIKIFTDVVNQGIDANLEGFTRSQFTRGEGQFGEPRLMMNFHRSELAILVRRLEEVGTEEAERWAEDIKDTPEYAEALTHPEEPQQVAPEASRKPVMIPEASDEEIDAIVGDDGAITGKATGWMARAAQMDGQGFFDVPKEFLSGRPEVDSMQIRNGKGVIDVILMGKTFRDVHQTFDGSDWKRGWNNGVKKMLNLSMPQDKLFNDWLARMFNVTRDNPTGKVIVPEVTDDEVEAAIGGDQVITAGKVFRKCPDCGGPCEKNDLSCPDCGRDLGAPPDIAGARFRNKMIDFEKWVAGGSDPDAMDDANHSIFRDVASTRPTIVRMAGGKFGLRIARSDLKKVARSTADGRMELSKKALVSLAQRVPYSIKPVKDKMVRVRTDRQCSGCSETLPSGSTMRNVSLETMWTSDCDYPSYNSVYFCDRCSGDATVQGYIGRQQENTKEHHLPPNTGTDEETARMSQDAFDQNRDFFRV